VRYEHNLGGAGSYNIAVPAGQAWVIDVPLSMVEYGRGVLEVWLGSRPERRVRVETGISVATMISAKFGYWHPTSTVAGIAETLGGYEQRHYVYLEWVTSANLPPLVAIWRQYDLQGSLVRETTKPIIMGGGASTLIWIDIQTPYTTQVFGSLSAQIVGTGSGGTAPVTITLNGELYDPGPADVVDIRVGTTQLSGDIPWSDESTSLGTKLIQTTTGKQPQLQNIGNTFGPDDDIPLTPPKSYIDLVREQCDRKWRGLTWRDDADEACFHETAYLINRLHQRWNTERAAILASRQAKSTALDLVARGPWGNRLTELDPSSRAVVNTSASRRVWTPKAQVMAGNKGAAVIAPLLPARPQGHDLATKNEILATVDGTDYTGPSWITTAQEVYRIHESLSGPAGTFQIDREVGLCLPDGMLLALRSSQPVAVSVTVDLSGTEGVLSEVEITGLPAGGWVGVDGAQKIGETWKIPGTEFSTPTACEIPIVPPAFGYHPTRAPDGYQWGNFVVTITGKRSSGSNVIVIKTFAPPVRVPGDPVVPWSAHAALWSNRPWTVG